MKLRQKYAKDFYLYMRVLLQEKTTKNKIYSLHETHAYAINKGKDHKGYEFGVKASIVTTKDSGIIVGVTAHCKNEHDSKTLDKALNNASSNTKVPIYEAICDRGYKGVKEVMINLKNKDFLSLISQVKFSIHKPAFNLLYLNALNNYTIKHTIKISIPATVLKRDTKKQLEIKREKFKSIYSFNAGITFLPINLIAVSLLGPIGEPATIWVTPISANFLHSSTTSSGVP